MLSLLNVLYFIFFLVIAGYLKIGYNRMWPYDPHQYGPVIIIGITGTKGSGKDTFAKYLIEHFGFIRLAFADKLKEACQIIFGFSDDQIHDPRAKEIVDSYWKHTPREILQIVGTELFRDKLSESLSDIGQDIWIRSVDRQIKNMIANGKKRFVITDVRFPDELEYISRINGYTVKIFRDNANTKRIDAGYDVANKLSTHKSEIMIDKFECDYLINNNKTIQELHYQAHNLYNLVNPRT